MCVGIKLEDQSPVPAERCRRRIIWLVTPAWIALFIELLGGWRFSKDSYSEYYAIGLGPFYPLTSLIIGVVLASPLLIVAGFESLLSKRNNVTANRRWLRGLLALLVVSPIVSMFSCAWTCGGHPTWINGYK
jgi:hypothetical protein